MKINEQTKIGALIKENIAALEAIVSISPMFKKLRNPILRKLVAGRTTISMACKIGGVKPEDFFNVLTPLGFQIDHSLSKEEPQTDKIETQMKPAFLQTAPEQIVTFDVREILANGQDPLKEIQQKVKSLKSGEILLIINTFEPVPLIKLLGKQGFETFVKSIDPNTIYTYFYKPDTKTETNIESQANISDSGDWDNILAHYSGKLQEIDVRHLEMPQPMMKILEALEILPQNNALFVFHKKIPIFLLAELKDRNFDYRIKEVKDGEVYMIIFHANV